MEHRVTARRVWDDIEFELMQGLPSQDDLGRSIRAAQQLSLIHISEPTRPY